MNDFFNMFCFFIPLLVWGIIILIGILINDFLEKRNKRKKNIGI